MADLTKAKNLLRSAEDLFVRKEFAGVAGLAYQAFEVGIIVLSENLQEILKDHLSRRKKAEEFVLKKASVADLKLLYLTAADLIEKLRLKETFPET